MININAMSIMAIIDRDDISMQVEKNKISFYFTNRDISRYVIEVNDNEELELKREGFFTEDDKEILDKIILNLQDNNFFYENLITLSNPNKNKHWTNKEHVFLRNNIDKLSYDAIADRLGRTKTAIIEKANMLGLRKNVRKWSKEDDDFLIDNYDNMTNKEIGKELGRTDVAVRARYHSLKIRDRNTERYSRNTGYLDQEIMNEIFEDHDVDNKLILKFEIRNKAITLAVKVHPSHKVVIEASPEHSINGLYEIFKFSEINDDIKINELSLIHTILVKWNMQRVITFNAGEMKKISNLIKHKQLIIDKKREEEEKRREAIKLEKLLKKYPNYNTEWSNEELQYIKDNYMKMTDKELSAGLGRTPGSVSHVRIYRLKLKKR